MEQTPAIETQSLSIGYQLKGGQRKVVHEALDLQLHAGEVTCLLGLNGAGKSTLLRTLCGFQPPLQGEIRLMGKPLENYSQSRFALTVGVVLTEKITAGGLTVFELVSLGRHPYTGFFGHLKATDKAIIHYVAELSDGERQKIMIAKALAQQCPIILLDEPTAFLDVTSRIETMALLHRLASEQGKAILLSTHDLDLAIQMGDCLWLQAKDRPMACGTPEDLIMNGAFKDFFDRDNIQFDPQTGKLQMQQQMQPIGVTGDQHTAFWVGNALIRQGFQPSVADPNRLNIHCISPLQHQLVWPDGSQQTTHSVAELLTEIHQRIKCPTTV